MILNNMDSLNGVLVAALDKLYGLDHHLGVEVVFSADDLGAHGGLGAVNQTVLTQVANLHAEVVLDVLAGLSAGNLVAAHDASGVQLVLDQLIRPLQ